jgi:hypothetical protein
VISNVACDGRDWCWVASVRLWRGWVVVDRDVDRLNVIDGRTVPQMEVLISELERSTTPNTVAPEPKQEIHAGQVARISGVGYALAVCVVLVECQISRHG